VEGSEISQREQAFDTRCWQHTTNYAKRRKKVKSLARTAAGDATIFTAEGQNSAPA